MSLPSSDGGARQPGANAFSRRAARRRRGARRRRPARRLWRLGLDGHQHGTAGSAKQSDSVFYWISHGAPGDQIWVLAENGASKAGPDLGVTVRTSLLNNNVQQQEEAITSAIAAKAAGIATTSPQAGVLKPLVRQAAAAGIPVLTMNVDDPDSGRLAFVGPNSFSVGQGWAQYLLDNKLIKAGDTVWLPVEQVGAA